MLIIYRRLSVGIMMTMFITFFIAIVGIGDVKAATYDDINASEVFLKQRQVDSCTLCSATMMIRRAMIMRGDSNWEAYTENKVATRAWADGLMWDFSVNGINVTRESLTGTAAQKKSYLINMLNQHPEGIVLYHNGASSQPHAVLLTEYTNGKFYCSEPWGGKPEGIIPLSSAISVTASNANVIWYVTNKLPELTRYTQGTATISGSSVNASVDIINVSEKNAVTSFAELNSNLIPSYYKKMKVTGLKVSSTSAQSMVVKWNKQTNISGYKIQYSKNKKFTDSKTKKVGKDSIKSKLTNLESGTTYYVRICAFKKNAAKTKNVYYKYSTIKKIKVK